MFSLYYFIFQRHVYWSDVFLFFFETPNYVQAKNGLAHLDLDIWKWASKLTKLAGMLKQADSVQSDQKYFLQMKLINF